MNWIESMGEAIKYIEDNLNDDLCIADIASKAFISPFYSQKAFRCFVDSPSVNMYAIADWPLRHASF